MQTVAPCDAPSRPRRPQAHSAFRLTVLALSLGCLSGAALADATTDRIKELERKLEQSLQRISDLSARVQQLEAGQGASTGQGGAAAAAPAATAAAAPTPDAAANAKRIDGLEQQVAAISNRSTLDDGLPVHGFASVGGIFTNRAGAKRGATIESLDFYLAPQFGDNVRALAELNFEVGQDGTVGTDLERLQLGYAFGDELTMWAGRFHTPYGYWNTAYHHGAQIQTSILRPRFLDFEDSGGILPAHNVGLWGHGKANVGGTRLEYDSWLANSPHISVDSGSDVGSQDPSLHGATNSRALFGLKLGVTPSALGGVTLGVHGFGSQVGGPDTGTFASKTLSSVRMLGGYATYLEDDWEVLGEYYHFHDKNLNTASTNYNLSYDSWAGYVQLGRAFGVWTPYVRLEKSNLDQNDDYFAAQESGRSYQRSVAGLRYDLSSRTALKFEFNHTRQSEADVPGDPAPGNFNELRLQFAARF